MFEVLFALLPMVILIIAMGICKWPGDKSSLLTLVITVMLATFAFGIPTLFRLWYSHTRDRFHFNKQYRTCLYHHSFRYLDGRV